MKVLVTGATGVVGRRLVPALTRAGHDVTAAGRGPGRLAALRDEAARTIVLDLFDEKAVSEALRGHDVVVNVATSVPPSRRALWPGAWQKMARLRETASSVLADAAIANGVGRMIQESFAPIYADGGDRWLHEDAPVKPARYNRAVITAEASTARVTRAGGVGIVLRFGYFYGPDSDYTTDAIRLVRHGWAPVIGSPEGYLSSVSHDDAAAAVLAALDIPAGIYNVVDDDPLTRRDAFNLLARALDVAPPRFPPAWLRFLTGSLGETLARSQRISNRRLREASSWRPQYPGVREGWAKVVGELSV